ncbi:MAG: aspartate-semialdehyde dehydrogenase, partial [Nitrospira sp.]
MLKKKPAYTIAILGATGAVGKETLEILEERKFPIESLRLFASKRSAGNAMPCQGCEWKIEELTPSASFAGVDFALISATDEISKEYGKKLGAAGVVVIDDSSVFRMDADVPLVVPEVNGQALTQMPRGIVAIPNCTTTPLVMALKPLQEAAGIKRVVVTTFQSVSGTGLAAMDELVDQAKALLSFRDVEAKVY